MNSLILKYANLLSLIHSSNFTHNLILIDFIPRDELIFYLIIRFLHSPNNNFV